jgi:hypothetical protein
MPLTNGVPRGFVRKLVAHNSHLPCDDQFREDIRRRTRQLSTLEWRRLASRLDELITIVDARHGPRVSLFLGPTMPRSWLKGRAFQVEGPFNHSPAPSPSLNSDAAGRNSHPRLGRNQSTGRSSFPRIRPIRAWRAAQGMSHRTIRAVSPIFVELPVLSIDFSYSLS